MTIYPANGQFQGPTVGITKVAVSGFKSLANRVEIEVRPLTVLAGANSSGKSALMQPLLLIKQTLETSLIPAGPFLLSGPYLEFTKASQFLSRGGDSSSPSGAMGLEFWFDQGSVAGMAYAVDPFEGLEISETWGWNPTSGSAWKMRKGASSEELGAALGKLGSLPNLMLQRGMTELTIDRSSFYQSVKYSTPSGVAPVMQEIFQMLENMILNTHIVRTIYVSGIRGGQHRRVLRTEISSDGIFFGPFEGYTASLIENWHALGPSPRLQELTSALAMMGLASGIRSVRLSESEIELQVPRTLESNDYVNIADVGLAVPTVIPVVAAAIVADPGQLVYIEQPELHLHPRAQLKLAQLLVQAANRGVRLVIETHSSLLLQGIMTQVAKGEISRENVALHWFARNEEGITKVTTADIDAEGRYGDWPSDFDDVELKATNAYLDAVETKLMERKGAA